jgi:hypothetical protein
MAKKVRLTLELTEETHEDFSRIAKIHGCTLTAMIRQGVALLKIARDSKKDGMHFGLASNADNLDKVIVGLFS